MRRPWALRLVAVGAAAGVAACTPGGTAPHEASGTPAASAASQVVGVDLPELVRELEPSVVTLLGSGGGQGSGVVYREDGVIVTNQHVGRAGVEPGDVVVEAGHERVRTVEDVLGVLRGTAPGARLALTVVREGEERVLEVVVADRPR